MYDRIRTQAQTHETTTFMLSPVFYSFLLWITLALLSLAFMWQGGGSFQHPAIKTQLLHNGKPWSQNTLAALKRLSILAWLDSKLSY